MDKTLVIYYSFTGNSKKVAEYVKNKLNADMIEKLYNQNIIL